MKKHKPEISQEEFEEIERYLLDRLPKTQREDFGKRMESDPALREEVALQQKLMTAVELGAFGTDLKEPSSFRTKTRKIPSDNVWLYAAVLVGVVISSYLGWVLLREAGPRSSTDLYTAYFYPDPGLPVVMSSTDDYEFYDGMVSYKEGHYAAAFDTWSTLATAGALTDTLAYYLGMAALNQGKTDVATHYLDPLIQAASGEFYDKALWYRALVHLKEGENATAADLLARLPTEPRVEALLDELTPSP